MKLNIFVGCCLLFLGCAQDATRKAPLLPKIRVGAERLGQYLPMLKDRRVALVVNHSSRVGERHLLDTLLSLGVDVRLLFAPEHGFRGKADAGEQVADGRDSKTGIPLRSLYGKQKKPARADMDSLDVVVFDIQDVGVRFYTYISTLHYVMEACSEVGLPLVVLDRPNPHRHYVNGPLLDTAFRSFVGMHPVPVVYGLTIGEYARMINGEGWLESPDTCALTVVPCSNYSPDSSYILPVPPSPNLPNMRAIYLYPSLCFFEGTVVSVGRGTDYPFQWYGHPALPGDSLFTPVPGPGARYPKLEGQTCRGRDLTILQPDSIRQWGHLEWSYLLEAYADFPQKDDFFLETGFFDLLAGTDRVRLMIRAGVTREALQAKWQDELGAFREKKKAYELY